jgi:RNA polymerase subunit RPABC4/transcription elongation factor Spt4
MAEYKYKCPECDADVSEDDESCPNCHASFVLEEDDEECPVCGNIISAETEVCPFCGTVFEIVYEEYEDEEPEPEGETEPGPAGTEIDDQMDLDAEIRRIEKEEDLEKERLREEEGLALSMSQEQMDELFRQAVESRGDITSLQGGDNELQEILDRMTPLLEAADHLGIDVYAVHQLRDRTYMALHQGDKATALNNANQALGLMESYIEDSLFYEQHFIGRIISKYEGQEGEGLRNTLQAMVLAREERRFPEALMMSKELREMVEEKEPGFQASSASFRVLTHAVAVAERFLIDNRNARSIINQTRDLIEKGRWKSIADLCDAGLERLMVVMRERAQTEFERIRSETAIAKRKGESGDDFLLSAAAEAQRLLAEGQYVQALDRISRYREEYRRPAA